MKAIILNVKASLNCVRFRVLLRKHHKECK
jgi:hypothetical protein